MGSIISGIALGDGHILAISGHPLTGGIARIVKIPREEEAGIDPRVA